jgi:hypothetical protein
MKKQSTMTAQEFEQRFDEGEDITPFIDMSSIRHPGVEPRRVNVDFPEWMIEKLDWQSRLIGVSRQALVKLWISERIQKEQQIQKSLAPSALA